MGKKNELLAAYNFRYATKEFDLNRIISDEDFEYILETGRLSPSSFGWEPWKFLVVQDMDLREKIREFAWGAQKQLPTASHFVLFMARKSVHTKAGSDYLNYMATDVQKLPADIVEMKLNFYEKFQLNDFDLTDDRKLFDWASKQIYIPFANMMTAAALIGIDSCPIEGFDRAKVEEILQEAGIINIDEFGLSVMAAFGYRAPADPVFPKTRQAVQKVAEWVV